ncbi:MAG: hypothetical protein AAFU57_06625 [Bacteroidota bacterium]
MIQESTSNDSQNVVFCVPIDKYEAERINSVGDLRELLRGGISTKILYDGRVETIVLKQRKLVFDEYFGFQTTIFNTQVRFYISKLNRQTAQNQFGIEHYYSGETNYAEFANIRFVILEPNLNDLDKLYLEHKVIFVDLNY